MVLQRLAPPTFFDRQAQGPCRRARSARCDAFVVSNLLIISAVVLLGLKFGLGMNLGIRERLRAIFKAIDGLVNVLLVLILAVYGIQLVLMLFKQ